MTDDLGPLRGTRDVGDHGQVTGRDRVGGGAAPRSTGDPAVDRWDRAPGQPWQRVVAGIVPEASPGGGRGDGTRRPGPLLLHSVGLVAFVLAGLLGRTTAVEGVALAWPVAGVAATWVVAAGRQRWTALLLVAVAAWCTNVLTGTSPQVGLVFAVTNLVLALTFAEVLHRRCPDLWGLGGERAADERGPLGWIVVAALAAGTLESVTAAVGLALVGSPLDLEGALAFAGADASSVTAVFVVAHLAAHRMVVRGARSASPPGTWVALSLLTVAVHAVVFGQDAVPAAFVAVLWIVFVGVRGDVLLAVAQVVLGSSVMLALHLAGTGPFTTVEDVRHQATTVQAFLAASLVAALFVASTRGALDDLAHRLRRAETEAAAQAEMLEAAFESMSEAVSVISADGQVLRSNRGAREVAAMIGAQMRLGGVAMSSVDGEPIPPDRTPSRRALAGEVVQTDVLLRDLDGAPRIFHVHATPLQGREGDGHARALAVFRDVTRERAVVDDLENFAATVAHDLRGPLTGVRGWADLAAQLAASGEGAATAGLQEAVERIRQGAERMDGLISDLLVHATSRAGELEVAPVDLAAVIRGVVEDRALESVVHVDALPPVLGDTVLLRHLVDNLVGNAVAYARPGVPAVVTVTGELAGHEARRSAPPDQGSAPVTASARSEVLLHFSDNGRGVPPDLRERIFGRFERVPGTGVEGTGLGLAICRGIVERHGGSITVSDGPGGEGSTFTVRLPAAPG